MQFFYTPYFLRQLKKLSPDIFEEAKEKIDLFKNQQNHSFLKTHKLKGSLDGTFSFSVNYSYRIIFEYYPEDSITFLAIGDHDVYK